jgi:hypothetical protein
MKHLKRIFENKEEDKKYIEECFFDISENPNFEVNDILEVECNVGFRQLDRDIRLYKLQIKLGKNISLPNPVNSNFWIGKVETSLEFLKMKNKKLSELYSDIEVAIKRIKYRFDYCDIRIESNRREEIDITIVI